MYFRGAVRHIFVGLLSLWAASGAHASCGKPVFKLLWTYPVDGAVEVPTNAAFWFVTEGGGGQVRLDGTPLSPGAVRGQWVWGDLTPNSDHVLTLEASESTTTVRFRTGAGPTSAPAALTVAGHEEGGQGPVANIDGCFDTPPYTRVEVHPEGDTAIPGFLINGAPWSATRGAPATNLRGENLEGACLELAPIGVGGLVGPATEYCLPRSDDDDGCSLGGGAQAGWLTAAMLWCLRRRRLEERT